MKNAFVFLAFLTFLTLDGKGQLAKRNLVYVDKKGVLRYTKGNGEAAFFGVNYTIPFAYGYRSHKALGIDPEKAIDADVYHMKRLGLDAFRVHVWDVEISDSLGNLLQNEHLRLFDYLLYKLKQQNIKILITPIAFWGAGYPEPDVRTIGFSSVYGKGPAVVNEKAIRAQENYLTQFFRHVNPYTQLTYRDDPDVIATEINNEPKHSGPKERTTEYVNRMVAAVKSTGWTKPVFYNISESPAYADAVAKARVDGFSFQWYPTGLVANHEQKGNFLPHVDRYFIPFTDTITAFRNRARMVYEFDAGDVMQPIMYPAMARSFRTAGFQWATQFAYDPLYTAYGNTEYQTHYLNLLYTPAKAISLLIAAKAFHRLPRGKTYGTYPADSLFDVFRVSYLEQLSEMNSDEEFYYTSNTVTQPKNMLKLKHLAGVGSSPVVQYEGSGAYFLDKLADNTWRLEVMPDAIRLSDPFEKASPRKAVTRLQWNENAMQFSLPFTKTNIVIRGVDSGNHKRQEVAGNLFTIRPGVYLITASQKEVTNSLAAAVPFYAPSQADEVFLSHQPFTEVSPGKPLFISVNITGADSADSVAGEVRNSSNKWKNIRWQRQKANEYKAEIPTEMITPGILNYRLILKKKNGNTYTFPGGFKGDPYAWDEYRNEWWQTIVAAPEGRLELFNPATDRSRMMLYNPDWRNNTMEAVTTGITSRLVWKATINKSASRPSPGFQFYFRDKTAGRNSELSLFTKMVIRARASEEASVNVSLITTAADAYTAAVPVGKEWKETVIPFSHLHPAAFLLLPRPYPDFQPLLFQAGGKRPFVINDAEKLEVRLGESGLPAALPFIVEVESVWLEK